MSQRISVVTAVLEPAFCFPAWGGIGPSKAGVVCTAPLDVV